VFSQYGAVVQFPRYTDIKTKTPVELKTEFRYRSVPIATSVPDLQLYMSMHPQKDDLDAPLWVSRKGGSLGYDQTRRVFKKAVKKAGVRKNLTLYSLRHMRLTQVAEVLASHELKQFAGHSKTSTVTPRYLHANTKQIHMKVFRERGVKLEEPEQKTPTLTIKVCPRCKHKNSPTYRFCAMCSMPLDMKTMFEVQRKAQVLQKDMMYKSKWNNWVDETEEGSEDDLFMKTVFTWIEKNPDSFKEYMTRAFQYMVADIIKNQPPTVKT